MAAIAHSVEWLVQKSYCCRLQNDYN